MDKGMVIIGVRAGVEIGLWEGESDKYILST